MKFLESFYRKRIAMHSMHSFINFNDKNSLEFVPLCEVNLFDKLRRGEQSVEEEKIEFFFFLIEILKFNLKKITSNIEF